MPSIVVCSGFFVKYSDRNDSISFLVLTISAASATSGTAPAAAFAAAGSAATASGTATAASAATASARGAADPAASTTRPMTASTHRPNITAVVLSNSPPFDSFDGYGGLHANDIDSGRRTLGL